MRRLFLLRGLMPLTAVASEHWIRFTSGPIEVFSSAGTKGWPRNPGPVRGVPARVGAGARRQRVQGPRRRGYVPERTGSMRKLAEQLRGGLLPAICLMRPAADHCRPAGWLLGVGCLVQQRRPVDDYRQRLRGMLRGLEYQEALPIAGGVIGADVGIDHKQRKQRMWRRGLQGTGSRLETD